MKALTRAPWPQHFNSPSTSHTEPGCMMMMSHPCQSIHPMTRVASKPSHEIHRARDHINSHRAPKHHSNTAFLTPSGQAKQEASKCHLCAKRHNGEYPVFHARAGTTHSASRPKHQLSEAPTQPHLSRIREQLFKTNLTSGM